MVLVGVSKSCYICLIPVHPGIKVNEVHHYHVLCHNSGCLPYVRSRASSSSFRTAPSRTGRARWSMNARLSAVISPDLWPPNSAVLDLVDHEMLGIKQQRLLYENVQDVGDLEHAAYDWCVVRNAPQVIDDVPVPVAQTYPCLIRAGHFEYSLWFVKQ